MGTNLEIDTTFDMRSDAGGRDPDRYSPTLRAYHQQLWSKPLPGGTSFTLRDDWPKGYLAHESELGHFQLTSDTILRTFVAHSKMQHIIKEVPPADQQVLSREGYTIAGFILFPGNRIDGKFTINQARGTHPRIQDRIDLTLECIRRHYEGESSPLAATIERYADFFKLFESFSGYVDFFLLQDLLTEDKEQIRFFLPFTDFEKHEALPRDISEYIQFRDAMREWISARARRIQDTNKTA